MKKNIRISWCKTKDKNYITIFFFFSLLLLRACYGFCWTDEAFYVSMADRMWSGTRFISEEWHFAQLYAIVLGPIVYVYKILVGSYEGIYLFLRMFTVIIDTVAAGILYRTLKRQYNVYASLIATITFMLYSRANIITFSYYEAIRVAYLFLLLCFFQCYEKKAAFLKGIVSGSGLAVTGIINPYLCVCYLIGFIIYLFLIKRHIEIFQFENIKYTFIGMCISGMLWISYILYMVLKNNSITEIMMGISQIVAMQNTHSFNENPFLVFVDVFLKIATRFRYTMFLSVILFLYLISTNKQFKEERKENVILILISIIFVFDCIQAKKLHGGVFIALAIYGIQIFILTKHKNWKVMRVFFIPGCVLAVAMRFSSDVGIDAMTVGFSFSAIASIIFISDYMQEKVRRTKWSKYICYGVYMITVLLMLTGRLLLVYRDANLWQLNTMIEKGPAKGLYTTETHFREYNQLMNVMEKYCQGTGHVLILNWACWAYLCTDMGCGAPTTWRLTIDLRKNEMAEYYSLYPEKIPDVIIALNPEVGGWEDHWFSSGGGKLKPQEDSSRHELFTEILNNQLYEEEETELCKVYIRK